MIKKVELGDRIIYKKNNSKQIKNTFLKLIIALITFVSAFFVIKIIVLN